DMDKLVDDECKLVHFASDTAINRHNKILLPNERFIPDFESFCCRLEKLEIFLFHLHAFPIGRVRDLFHIFIPSNENSTCDSIVNFIQALWAVRVGFNEMISEFLIINEIARESRANLVGKFHDSAFILDCKKFLTFASPKRGSS
ncbi:5797_t:CDS:2, partial [Gigaspora rosea]